MYKLFIAFPNKDYVSRKAKAKMIYRIIDYIFLSAYAKVQVKGKDDDNDNYLSFRFPPLNYWQDNLICLDIYWLCLNMQAAYKNHPNTLAGLSDNKLSKFNIPVPCDFEWRSRPYKTATKTNTSIVAITTPILKQRYI